MFVKQSIVLLMCILLFVLCVNTASAGDGITYPSGGTINDFIFTIQASASGDIEYVRFYLHGDENAAGVNNWKNDSFWYYQEDYSSPYGATWNMVGIPNTRYTTMIWIKYKNGSINEEPGGRVYFNAYPNSWITGNWGSCSPSCGNGNQSRTIQCVNPNGTVLPNPDKDCYGMTKPDSTQSCYTYCPTYSWESDYWTSCNAPDNCGSGTQELIYKCVDDKNNTVSNSKCSGSPQTKTQSCEENSGCVYHWEYGSWGNCSETCGTGTKTRDAFCKDQSENSVSDSKCSAPDTTDNCTETSGCRSPVATILSIDPTSSEIAETISFKGSGNDPDSGAISAYQWRSSIDGELSTQASFSTSNLSVGTHTIYFKVQDDEGVWSTSVERDITINQEQCTNPEASFSTNIQTGELPLDVQFTDQSVVTQDDSIVSWEWNFGDGSDSSEQHPGHIYHTAGTYTVSLKVKNSCGQDVETKMNLIVVGKSNDSDDVDLSKGLVAYYPFNGNADDESGSGNHGVVYRATLAEDRYGNDNNAYFFNGEAYIDCGNDQSLNLDNQLTISAWIKSNTIRNSWPSFIAKYSINVKDNVGYGFGWGLASNPDNKYVFYIIDHHILPGEEEEKAISVSNVGTDKWNHVVGIYDGEVFKIFIDGVLEKTNVALPNLLNTNNYNLLLGTRFNDGIVSQGAFHSGFIDDVRIYDRVLSELEIQELYNEQPQTKIDLEKDLIAYYPFNGNANDESGNGNHGIEYGGLTYANGILNKAGSFDGVDDFIEVTPKSDVSAIENFTISVWTYLLNWKIQPNNYLYDRQYVFDGHTHSKTVMSDFYRPGFSVVFDGLLHSEEIRDSIFYYDNVYLAQNTKINIKGKWHHHVFMRIGDADYTYIDGQLINSTYHNDIKRDDPLNMKHNWFIGSFSGNNPNYNAIKDGYNYSFFGLLDEMRIYNRALSEPEIKKLYEIKQNHLSVSPISKNLLAVSGTTIFTVTSSIVWSATTNDSWITIQTSPNRISVDYTANFGGKRTAIITVSSESAPLIPQYIEITQNQKTNNPPEANNQKETTHTNVPINITLSATDTDNDPLTFTILTLPSNGTISNDPPNIIYTPDLDYQGVDEFTFKANDGTADSNIAHVSIQINPIPTTRHFIDVDGNPADNTWTTYLSSATLDGVNLQANDEIAIFDNETMVGSFKISEVLSDTNQLKNYLTAWSTLSDGNGYQAGHPYTFKCWDISQQKEYTCFHPILTNPYEDAFTGDVFPDGDAKYSIVRLNFLTSITQTIQLSTGYRFVSLNVLPDETEMTEILSPVLDHIDFAKDSKGNLLRKIGPDWINNIGLWKNTAGYLLRLNNNAVLNIEGLPVYPEIPVDLNPGYQFVAYLLTEPTDALSAFSDILEHLDFAKDSFGNLFRKIGPNWVNNIGNLNPGEGYLLKMNAADRLFYEKPVQIQRKSYRHKDTKQVSHFGEISGNPADATWTIYLAQAQLNETHLEANDEIAIFDGNKLVGAFQLTEPLTEEKQNNHYITAWSTLNDGDGYTAGNTYTFKCWDSSTGLEYSNDELTLLNPYNDAYTDAVFPSDDANYSIATIVFSETSHKPGDMNDDGIIDLKDAVWILKMLVGME
jgi:PKD repeat protein